jgi:hypothetical protein
MSQVFMFVNCVSPDQVISTMIINTLRPVTRFINPSIAVGFLLPTVFSKGDTEKCIAGGGEVLESA